MGGSIRTYRVFDPVEQVAHGSDPLLALLTRQDSDDAARDVLESAVRFRPNKECGGVLGVLRFT